MPQHQSGDRDSNLVSYALLTLFNTHLSSTGIIRSLLHAEPWGNSYMERKQRKIEQNSIHSLKKVSVYYRSRHTYVYNTWKAQGIKKKSQYSESLREGVIISMRDTKLPEGGCCLFGQKSENEIRTHFRVVAEHLRGLALELCHFDLDW